MAQPALSTAIPIAALLTADKLRFLPLALFATALWFQRPTYRFGHHAHLELRVIAPEGAPIPVTETGYLSHHVYPVFVKSAGGPVAYVRKWLDREARNPSYYRALDRWRQLDLFA